MGDSTDGRVAARLADRPRPRVASAVAGAGCLIAYFGSHLLSGDALGDEFDGGSQIPGIVIFALMVAGGLALVAKAPGAAFATAGSFTAILAVPPLVFYVTFDRDGFPGYSTEGILAISAAAWLLMHLAGPSAGRTFPLGAGLVAAWMLLLQVTEEPFTAPFDFVDAVFEDTGRVVVDEDLDGGFDDRFAPTFDAPDPTVLGVLSLLVGIGFAVAGLRLHRAGQAGRATAFAAATALVLPSAVVLLVPDLEEWGTGLLLVALGLGLTIAGAAQSRRGTTWLGAFGCFLGITLIVGEILGDAETAAIGATLLATGALVVVGAHLLSDAIDEPDELDPAPSPLPGRPATGGGATGGPTGGITEF